MKRMMMAGLLAGLASVAPAGAATLYVGHGIDGRDLGFLDPDLPVDICLVSGPSELPFTYPVELLSGVKFADPFAKVSDALPAGRYDVEVQLAAGGTCDGPVAIASSIFLGFGENATALAHVSEFGTPTLTKFENDVRRLAGNETRLFARHAAAFSDVSVLFKKGYKKEYFRGLENGDQEGDTLRAGSWYVAIYPEGSWHPVFEATLPLAPKTATFAYAVGSPANGTFRVLTQTVDIP